MDRISTLRNIEDALAAYEDDDLSLPELEQRVRGLLRTYATEFQPEATAYRASGPPSVDGIVVVATSRHEARETIEGLVADPGSFDIEAASEF
jgi:hypothetical protein